MAYGRALCWCLAALLGGCYTGSQPVVPGPSFETFRDEVYPILLRDCGFSACHGNEDRYYQVYGPGRLRLDPETELFDEPTPEEIEMSYERARAMLLHRGDVRRSELLRKPVEGGGHAGLDGEGRNVYSSPHDQTYETLVAWALLSAEQEP